MSHRRRATAAVMVAVTGCSFFTALMMERAMSMAIHGSLALALSVEHCSKAADGLRLHQALHVHSRFVPGFAVPSPRKLP